MSFLLSVSQLAGFGYELPGNVEILLNKGDSVFVRDWYRVLPGKRFVGGGEYKGTPVLAKLFYGERAARKASAEVHGIKLLTEAGLPTPLLVADGSDAKHKIAWVLTEFVPSAQTLSALTGLSTENPVTFSDCPPAVSEATVLVAKMHQEGLIQRDLHPDNLLYNPAKKTWLLIDPGDIQSGEVDVIDNFALFLAQFPDRWWDVIASIYRDVSGNEISLDEVRPFASAWCLKRAENLAAKSVRNCSLFKVKKSFRHFQAAWRKEIESLPMETSALDGLLLSGKSLKQGASATVGIVETGGQQVVVKRYNIKNVWHLLRRLLRRTRAWHSWKMCHRLRVLGFDVPKPIALIEERVGPITGRGFFIMAECRGEDLKAVIDKGDRQTLSAIMSQMSELLERMSRYRIAHGDFKASNFIWNDRLYLIDLDSVRFFKSERAWRKAYNADLDRLLENWPEDSWPHQTMAKLIEKYR